MLKYLVLCVLVASWKDAHGHIEELTEIVKRCCDDVSVYSSSHTEQECSSSRSIPDDVPASYTSLCIVVRAQCCKEYAQKKRDCDAGIEVALSKNECDADKNSSTTCCNECARGTSIGHARGSAACVGRVHSDSAEDLLSDDAYIKCCQKAAKEGLPSMPHPVTISKKGKREHSATIASLCEDYAPNELCAHHCIPVPGSYKCECNPGFMLMADGRNCKEVVKNRCKPRNHCQHKCNDNGVEVKCSCRRGYELMPDGKSCQDIDECQLDIPVCLPGTQCFNIQGSYRCIPEKKNKPEKGQCPPGFTRNLANQACDDINECKLPQPPCPPYICENTVGGYKCGGISGDPVNLSSTSRPMVEDRCPPGFALGTRGECEDLDECAIRKDDCNQLSQFCINTHSSFFCQDKVSKLCRPGFKIDPNTGKCEDINECEEDEGLCRTDQICVNQLGQYDCKQKPDESILGRELCPDGMRKDPATLRCEDINECVEGTHLCDQHQNCLNTNGSYECHCKLGYELDITTGACVDVNECATSQHDCISGSQRCDNTVGSYLCIRITSCGTGYILQHATGNCEDVDECALGIHNCMRAGPEFQCMNIPGSFRCVRKRASTTTTTSTTLPPDMYEEYEYYDSVEETDNKTESNPAPPPVPVDIPYSPPSSTSQPPPTTISTTPPPPTTVSTTPAPPPPTTSTEPQTTPKEEPRIEDNSVYSEQESGGYQPGLPLPSPPQQNPYYNTYDRVPESSSYDPEPKPTETTKTEIKPTEPELSYSEPTEPRPESPNQPDIIYKYLPETPDHSETPDGTYYFEVPERSDSNKPKNSEPDPTIVLETEPPIIRLEPKEVPTYSPYRPTEAPKVTPPYAVNVNVGEEEESATVSGVRREDGSVFLDTKDVPKNTWTNVNVKPVCPAGFEPNDIGGCFDIDECAMNQHSCSGLTEVCRNTFGGYLCDCAAGFRRDSTTGACDIMPVSSTTQLPSVFKPDVLPPIVTSSTSTSTTSTTSTTTEPPPPPTTTAVPSTSPRLRSFWGYKDTRFLASRPFYPRFTCDSGYHKNSETGKCEDINECTNGQANCAALEICVNTEGGYKCECPPNWRLDDVRHRCMPIVNEGLFPPGYGNIPEYPPPDQDHIEPVSQETDSNSVFPDMTQVEDRGVVLQCRWGYRLGDDGTCVDIDECATGEARCEQTSVCTNLPGGYVCSCPRGHARADDGRCVDVDECSLAGNTSICSQNADCMNTVGSYQCRCHEGFRSAPVNDKVCVDVDECAESRAGSLCEHRCSNVWGSYRCFCHRGYRLNPDNRTCSDVDECVQFKSKIPCIGQCLNEPGSYRCACPRGYRLSEDNRSCIDIDECETREATCETGIYGGTSHVCFNTRGSYRCQRISCPPGYQLESKHRCSKTERVCKPGDWECAHQPTTISYNFITFVSKLFIPDSNVKLFTMRGPVWPYAKMKFELRLVNVNAPPSVKEKADIGAFLLIQNDNEGVMSLVRPLEGPQSIELELSMELHSRDQFGGIAIAKLFIFVSEYEF